MRKSGIMPWTWGWVAVIAAALLLSSLAVSPPARAGTKGIRIVGSTTMGPLMREMIFAYQRSHPEVHFALTGSGSGNGASALAAGTADIALLSRGMTRQETVLCVRGGVVPRRIILALDGLVPIVHPQNPVSNLSLGQVRAIYSGELRNWKSVGGPDLAVEPLGRSLRSGTHDVWGLAVMGSTPEMEGLERAHSNADMVQAVRSRPGAIGYVGMGFVDGSVRAVRLDNVEAAYGSVLEDSYPAARSLNIYIGKTASHEVRAFVDFALGDSGRSVIEGAGFIPVASE